MQKYILKRLLWMIVILAGAAFVVFSILYLSPGDPAREMLGPDASQSAVEALQVKLGIDQPYLVQLGNFYKDVFLHLDLGESWTYHVPVVEELMNRLPRTLIIGIFAMILNVAVGLPLGIYAATHEGRLGDSLSMAIAMIFVSLPNFWVALMMVVQFSLRMNLLPPSGIDGPENYIMPVIASSLAGIAVNARQTRSSMLEVIRADFITTARAKGQAENVVVTRHMLPNALMPIITSLGNGFARIVAGQVVIESVFSIPGIGTYMLSGINSRDYPVVRGCVLFFALFTAVTMLLVDLIYAFVDPRIKAQYQSGKKV